MELPAEFTARPLVRSDLDEGYAVRPFIPGIEDEAFYEGIQTAFGEWPDRERTPYEDWLLEL